MKVIVIGATGIIGKNIVSTLQTQDNPLEIVTVSRKGP